MRETIANAARHALAGAFALTMLTAAATPALAMKEPPKEPISSSSGGSTGGSSGGTAVPEPSSLALFGAGAAAFMAARRRKAPRT